MKSHRFTSRVDQSSAIPGRSRRPFSLVELLMVIAVIAVLVAMLMPALNQAKERAKVLQCVTNHKQMAMALIAYAESNDRYTGGHQWYTDLIGFDGVHNWSPNGPRYLNEYVGGDQAARQIVKCPSDKGDPPLNSLTPVYGNTVYKNFGNSYGVFYTGGNINIGQVTSVNGSAYKRISSFDYPSNKISFHPQVVRDDRKWLNPQTNWHNEPTPKFPVSFIDGHASNFLFWWRAIQNCPGGPNIDRDGYY